MHQKCLQEMKGIEEQVKLHHEKAISQIQNIGTFFRSPQLISLRNKTNK